jgi:hypothetical protein
MIIFCYADALMRADVYFALSATCAAHDGAAIYALPPPRLPPRHFRREPTIFASCRAYAFSLAPRACAPEALDERHAARYFDALFDTLRAMHAARFFLRC